MLNPYRKQHLLALAAVLIACTVSGFSAVAWADDSPKARFTSYVGEDVTDAQVAKDIAANKALHNIKFVQTGKSLTDNVFKDLNKLSDLLIIDGVKTEFTGAGIKYLTNTPKLEHLSIMTSPIADDQLRQLALLNLKHLSFRECPVTNTGAWYISYVPTLEYLDLSTTRVSDNGVECFKKLPNLRFLYLLQTKVSDASADFLVSMKSLELLDIRDTLISDKTLHKVVQLPKLRQLMVGSPRVTDAGVAALKGNKTIERLNLSNSAVTDAALPVLSTMQKLESVELNHTQVTPEGIANLKKLKPRLSVWGP